MIQNNYFKISKIGSMTVHQLQDSCGLLENSSLAPYNTVNSSCKHNETQCMSKHFPALLLGLYVSVCLLGTVLCHLPNLHLPASAHVGMARSSDWAEIRGTLLHSHMTKLSKCTPH